MKVVLFDSGHFETAYTLIRLFDVPGNQITIITDGQTEDVLKTMLQEEEERYDWIIADRWISDWNYFTYVKKQLSAIRADLIYLNTIDRQPLYYALLLNFLPQSRVIMTIHDVNCFFYKGKLSDLRQLLKWTSKKLLLRETEALNVIAETMIAHLRKHVNNRIPLFHIPGAVFEQLPPPLVISDRIRLVVPGTIDKKRRNYDDVFLLCELLEEAALPVDVILLGGYNGNYGKAVITKAKHWPSRYTCIKSYDTPLIPQVEYDRVMRQAHFLFCPVEVHTRICGDVPEVYGISKSSGSLSDAVRHAKPIILPEAYKITSSMQSACFRYKTLNDITDLLYKIFRDPPAYQAWQENALRYAKWFTIPQVRERNLTLFFGEE
jgi:hypothetical protein